MNKNIALERLSALMDEGYQEIDGDAELERWLTEQGIDWVGYPPEDIIAELQEGD